MSAVAFADVKSKLLTIDQVQETIAQTEPFTSNPIAQGARVKFRLEPGWAEEIETTAGPAAIPAYVTVARKEFQLTKDALFLATSAFGLPQAYVKKLPAKFTEAQLNYWFGLGLDREFNMLAVGQDDLAAAFIKPTIAPFSNVQLLENVLQGLSARFGKGEMYADYKFNHSLNRTDIRLILPDYARVIKDTREPDDVWSAGLHLTNSLTGASQTGLESYLFRWWCTNGATERPEGVGTWNRRKNGQDEDIYEWARSSVNEIFQGMEDAFDRVQDLTKVEFGESANGSLKDFFNTYNVPKTQQPAILDELSRLSGNITMYDLMQAITVQANGDSVSPDRRDSLMRIGGLVPRSVIDNTSARIFREGQSDPEGPNPYELRTR